MMPMTQESDVPRERLVLRARTAYVLFGLVAVIVAAMAVDGFARGAAWQTLLVLPWFVAILWFIYLVLVRPCVVIDTQGVTVVNVFRRHRIPWPRLADAASRYQLSLTRDDGRTVSSWGAPTTGILGGRGSQGRLTASDAARLPGVRGFFERPTPTGESLRALEEMRARWAPGATDAAARSSWEWWTVIVSVLVVAACVWAVLVTR